MSFTESIYQHEVVVLYRVGTWFGYCISGLRTKVELGMYDVVVLDVYDVVVLDVCDLVVLDVYGVIL